MNTLDYYLYPIEAAPAATAKGDMYLHIAVAAMDGKKQTIGLAVEPEPTRQIYPIPVEDYVRLRPGENGQPDARLIEIAPAAKLSARDKKLLDNAVTELELPCTYIRKFGQPNTRFISVEPSKYDYIIVHGDEKLTYTLDGTSVVLACVRALALPRIASYLATQN